MARPIKFRGWNGEKMTHYNHWFTLGSQMTLCFEEQEEHSYVDDSDVDCPNRVILMQFTGLLDKNGKEIYEGDIIEGWLGERSAEVVFIKGSFRLNGHAPLAIGDANNVSEVIGNIYEHPDLIK